MRVDHSRMILSGGTVSLEGDPVRCFDQENIVGVRREECIPVATEPEITDRFSVRAALLPHEEERRSRMVFPAQHGVAAESAEIEVGIEERDWLRWSTGTVNIHRVLPAAVHYSA